MVRSMEYLQLLEVPDLTALSGLKLLQADTTSLYMLILHLILVLVRALRPVLFLQQHKMLVLKFGTMGSSTILVYIDRIKALRVSA